MPPPSTYPMEALPALQTAPHPPPPTPRSSMPRPADSAPSPLPTPALRQCMPPATPIKSSTSHSSCGTEGKQKCHIESPWRISTCNKRELKDSPGPHFDTILELGGPKLAPMPLQTPPPSPLPEGFTAMVGLLPHLLPPIRALQDGIWPAYDPWETHHHCKQLCKTPSATQKKQVNTAHDSGISHQLSTNARTPPPRCHT
ncbi:hypothetical protein E4T56_gene5673 [Termitomyces sp. T112]|nr:hypothetical protein E4T56_gene5673 [Termitomyces sp. T112]